VVKTASRGTVQAAGLFPPARGLIARLTRLAEWLPHGRVLPEGDFGRRHRAIRWILVLHSAVFAGIAWGLPLVTADARSAAEPMVASTLLGVLALAAGNRRWSLSARATVATLGLLVAAAAVVHLSSGRVEAHFHFFVVLGLIALYQDWRLVQLAVAFVFLHHGVVGALAPEQVFGEHTRGPPLWAAIHVAYVLSLGGTLAVSWRCAERQALRDDVTRLPNARHFVADVRRALMAENRRGTHVAVLRVHVTGLPAVHDALGSDARDTVLLEIAERLQSSVRNGDVVAHAGAGTFDVLVADVVATEEAIRVSARLRAALEQPVSVDDTRVLLTATVGIATASAGADGERLVRDADIAMHAARARCAGHAVFSPEMHDAVARRVTLAGKLVGAEDRGELRLHYQPVVDMATGAVVGFEALVRWCHPELGMVPPAHFIPAAEEVPASIIAVGRWVIDEAVRQAAAWARRHPDPPRTIGVNLSARQLDDPELPAVVEEALARNGLAPDRLVLEVTESAVLHDVDAAMATLSRLRALGVHVALDDFGTGCSSLTHLLRLPIDVVKIDRTFVAELPDDREALELTTAICDLAGRLGIEVVAEGIELPHQAAALRALGCTLGQGYHFGRPASADHVGLLLDELARLDPAGATEAGTASGTPPLERARAQADSRAVPPPPPR
jgi:diguanylate cyclase (GGDEF)-like protein